MDQKTKKTLRENDRVFRSRFEAARAQLSEAKEYQRRAAMAVAADSRRVGYCVTVAKAELHRSGTTTPALYDFLNATVALLLVEANVKKLRADWWMGRFNAMNQAPAESVLPRDWFEADMALGKATQLTGEAGLLATRAREAVRLRRLPHA